MTAFARVRKRPGGLWLADAAGGLDQVADRAAGAGVAAVLADGRDRPTRVAVKPEAGLPRRLTGADWKSRVINGLIE